MTDFMGFSLSPGGGLLWRCRLHAAPAAMLFSPWEQYRGVAAGNPLYGYKAVLPLCRAKAAPVDSVAGLPVNKCI
ncbi:MAG: hypothetical protein U1F63_16135 [Chitinivorax sp.]